MPNTWYAELLAGLLAPSTAKLDPAMVADPETLPGQRSDLCEMNSLVAFNSDVPSQSANELVNAYETWLARGCGKTGSGVVGQRK